MGWRRFQFAQSLMFTGGGILALGILLVLIKLMMFIAWYAAGAVVLAGAMMFLTGLILRRY